MQFSGFSEDQRVGCNGNFLKFTYVFQDLFLFTCISIKPNGSTTSLKRSIKPIVIFLHVKLHVDAGSDI